MFAPASTPVALAVAEPAGKVLFGVKRAEPTARIVPL